MVNKPSLYNWKKAWRLIIITRITLIFQKKKKKKAGHLRLYMPTGFSAPCKLNLVIIRSKYFPDSDWLKAHA